MTPLWARQLCRWLLRSQAYPSTVFSSVLVAVVEQEGKARCNSLMGAGNRSSKPFLFRCFWSAAAWGLGLRDPVVAFRRQSCKDMGVAGSRKVGRFLCSGVKRERDGGLCSQQSGSANLFASGLRSSSGRFCPTGSLLEHVCREVL